MAQVAMFEEIPNRVSPGEEVDKPRPVRLGNRHVYWNRARARRNAWTRLRALLEHMRGKDVLVDFYSRNHEFWASSLLLRHMEPEFPTWGGKGVPSVVVLTGKIPRWRQDVRVFLDDMVNLRTNRYGGGRYGPYEHHLIDFWADFPQHPSESYKAGGTDSLILMLAKQPDPFVEP